MNKNILRTTKGFTIIEVSLFLAISGLLAASLMAGWTMNINRQRYNDTVSTFKSDIQQVFSEVENTQNTVKSDRYRCNGAGTNVQLILDNVNGNTRGTTDCIILGKMISFNSGDRVRWSPDFSQNFKVRDVIGLDIDSSTACGGAACANDISALRATKFIVSGEPAAGVSSNNIGTVQTVSMQWGAAYKAITDNAIDGAGNRPFSGDLPLIGSQNTIYGVLILRSPIDGSIRTFAVPEPMYTNSTFFTNDTARARLRNTFVDQRVLVTETKKVDMCIAQRYNSSTGGADNITMARNRVVRIGGTSSSVEIAPMDGPGSISCDNDYQLRGVIRN